MYTDLTPKQMVLGMVMSLIWGFVCMSVAKKRGRDPRAWYALGLFFSIFALAFLLLVPSKKMMDAAENAKKLEDQNLKAKEEKLKIAYNSTLENRKWYYLDTDHKQIGPVDFKTIKDGKLSGLIKSSTYLWSEGMLDWKKFDHLSYLRTELES